MGIATIGEGLSERGVKLEGEMLLLREAVGRSTVFDVLCTATGRGMQRLGGRLVELANYHEPQPPDSTEEII